MNVSYDPAAQAEAVEAVQWYLEVAGPTIAATFDRELHAAVSLLMRFPKSGSPGPKGSRMLRLDGFPYTLHYRLDGESIHIMAVASQSRRPGYWRGR